jgi:hypothetical protein
VEQVWYSLLRPVCAQDPAHRLRCDGGRLGTYPDPRLHEGTEQRAFMHYIMPYLLGTFHEFILALFSCTDAFSSFSSVHFLPQFPEYFEVKTKYEP